MKIFNKAIFYYKDRTTNITWYIHKWNIHGNGLDEFHTIIKLTELSKASSDIMKLPEGLV